MRARAGSPKSQELGILPQQVLESAIFRHPPHSTEAASGAKQVLVVCEDSHARAMIVFGLCCAGFAVREMAHIGRAHKDAVRRPPDLILLKVEEFVGQGLTFIQTAKKHSGTRGTPLMVLSEHPREAENLLSLEIGADDHLTVPFAPGELIARVQRLLRQSVPGITTECIQLHGLTLNPATHRISVGKRHFHASPTEYRFLELLLRNPERIFTRPELFRLIWGEQAEIDERTVDVYVLRVRKILSAAGIASMLQTIRGTGYCLSAIELEKR
jgi:two-component system, OmpR family, phosphate regulon response regulator PhoB